MTAQDHEQHHTEDRSILLHVDLLPDEDGTAYRCRDRAQRRAHQRKLTMCGALNRPGASQTPSSHTTRGLLCVNNYLPSIFRTIVAGWELPATCDAVLVDDLPPHA